VLKFLTQNDQILDTTSERRKENENNSEKNALDFAGPKAKEGPFTSVLNR